MKTKQRVMWVLIGCVSLPSVVLGHPTINQKTPIPEPFDNATILVKAFVVQVDLQSLYTLGVCPLDNDRVVTVTDLQTCLQSPVKAKVIAGQRVVVGQSSQVSSSQAQTAYINVYTAPGRKGYKPYQSGTNLDVYANVRNNNRIHIEYTWTQTFFPEEHPAVNQPPNTGTWDCTGTLDLDNNVPQITGAIQDDKKASFMILSAHILSGEKSNPSKTEEVHE
jgi:hypothetical protein